MIPAFVVGGTVHAYTVGTFAWAQENGDGHTPVDHDRHNIRSKSRRFPGEIDTVSSDGMRDEVENGTNVEERSILTLRRVTRALPTFSPRGYRLRLIIGAHMKFAVVSPAGPRTLGFYSTPQARTLGNKWPLDDKRRQPGRELDADQAIANP